MSDEGEKTCPLCAEEMDLTDQQLRPCKCGYEICVWCWHHIMDMAEKDNTDGRCPACRTPYNKEKIVGTASKCERLVTGMSVEKKQKSQKGKTKTSKGREQLGSVRVIQRNLVYIVGLPLDLADEDLLQQKEYFGQYGKVLKVSISRTAAGAIQQFANSTCSVYITYSKEEEAVRSIQAAHGFVLEGRTLRACFGTTKYCHAWLRNAPCTNADCLYLHEFGPQEDSFTKDEIISAHTRNKVQQITGATYEMQRRSGNLLPPPADDYSDYTTSAWPKPVSKTTTNNPANGIKAPQSNTSNGKSIALPAAASWGTRASNSQLSFKEPSNGDEELRKEKGSLGNPVSIKEDTSETESSNSSEIDQQQYSNHVLDEGERRISPSSFDNLQLQPKQSDLMSDLQKKVAQVAISEAEQDRLSFNNQRLRDTQVIQNPPITSNNFFGHNNPLHAHASGNGGLDSLPCYQENNIPVANGHSYFHGTEGCKSEIELEGGESSIISNILSMEFDPWDESLTSPQNLAKFLGDKDLESHRVLSSRKTQNSNQSRFSFARQDEGSDFENNNSIYLDNKLNNGNGFPSFSYGESENFATNYFPVSENNKISVSRAQVSAPPGFSGPSRAPPPGFSSQERMEQTYDNLFGNDMLVRKAHVPVNMVGDLELMDPAILAVGGRVNTPTTPTPGLDMSLEHLMQRSFSQQNPRFTQLGLNYPQQSDSYQQTSFQQQPRSSPPMSNGHYSWNGVESGNGIAMAELLRNERLGFTRYYSDTKFQMPTSADLYNNTTFGI